jgi:hypothetical protein
MGNRQVSVAGATVPTPKNKGRWIMRGLITLVVCFLLNCASVGVYAYAAQHDMPGVMEMALLASAE